MTYANKSILRGLFEGHGGIVGQRNMKTVHLCAASFMAMACAAAQTAPLPAATLVLPGLSESLPLLPAKAKAVPAPLDAPVVDGPPIDLTPADVADVEPVPAPPIPAQVTAPAPSKLASVAPSFPGIPAEGKIEVRIVGAAAPVLSAPLISTAAATAAPDLPSEVQTVPDVMISEVASLPAVEMTPVPMEVPAVIVGAPAPVLSAPQVAAAGPVVIPDVTQTPAVVLAAATPDVTLPIKTVATAAAAQAPKKPAKAAGDDRFSISGYLAKRRQQLVDDEPTADPSSVLESAWLGGPQPVEIQKLESLHDGDPVQGALALDFTVVGNTNPNNQVNSYFVDAPDTDGQVLRLRDVLIFTLKNNPDIGIARWQSEDARSAVRAARAPMLPQVDMTAASGVEGTYGEEFDSVIGLHRSEASLRVSQLLYDFGRTDQGLKRAKSLLQSQELLRRDVVEETVYAAISAYLDLLGTSQLLDNANQNVEAHDKIVSLVEKNFNGGNASEAELKRAQSRLDRARTAALDVDNRRERAVSTFRRVTGLEPSTLTEPTLDVSLAYELTQETLDIYVAENPVVQATMRDINSFDHQIIAAERANLPEISLQVASGLKDNVLGGEPWTADSRAMVAASWSVYDGGSSSARKRQLVARRRETEQRLIKVRNELKQDAYNIMSVLRTSQNKSDIFVEQVRDSERVMDLYTKQFQAGRRTLLELLDAQADLSSAREESIATRYENLAAAFAAMRFQNLLTYSLSDQMNLWSVLPDVKKP